MSRFVHRANFKKLDGFFVKLFRGNRVETTGCLQWSESAKRDNVFANSPKRHNVTLLMDHLVCPAKYRRAVFSREVELELKAVCDEIELRYEIEFLEIGANSDHVHFLVQGVPMYSPTKIVRIIKNITAREIFIRVPSAKKLLWGGEFWSKGYFWGTVGGS